MTLAPLCGLLKNGDATDDNRQPSAGTAERAVRYRLAMWLSCTGLSARVADADGRGLPPRWHLPMEAMSSATATNVGTERSVASFTIDIDTQPPVLEGTAVSDVDAFRSLPALRAGSTVVIQKTAGKYAR